MLSWKWRESGLFEECESIAVSSRAFRYGIGLFETIRVLDGRPQFVREHLARLAADAQERRLPAAPPVRDLASLIPPDFTGVMRVYWAVGEGSPLDPLKSAELFITLEFRQRPQPRPHRLVFAESAVAPLGAKTLNYWENIEALRRARMEGFDEAVLWKWQGDLKEGVASPVVVSCAMANLFWVIGGRIQTAALGSGARAGIIRSWLLRNAEVEEVLITPKQLGEAESLFLTNSWLGVVPVEQIGDRTVCIFPQVETWNAALNDV